MDTPPRPGEVHVWHHRLEGTPGLDPDPILTEAERSRLARIRDPLQRRRRQLARAGLRVLLSRYLHTPPQDIKITTTCRHCGGDHGKPRLAGEASVRFNTSYACGRVVYAVASDVEVGIDVEHALHDIPRDAVACVATPEVQRALFHDLPHPTTMHHWTRLEAYLKMVGYGLAPPPGFLPRQPFSIWSLELGWGYVAALATDRKDTTIQTFEFHSQFSNQKDMVRMKQRTSKPLPTHPNRQRSFPTGTGAGKGR